MFSVPMPNPAAETILWVILCISTFSYKTCHGIFQRASVLQVSVAVGHMLAWVSEGQGNYRLINLRKLI